MHHAVEPGPFFARFLDAVAVHDEGAGQNLQVIAIAAELVHAPLDIGIKFLSVTEAAAAGEHSFRGLRRELPAVLRGAGLDDHRPALHRAGDVERATHREIFSMAVWNSHVRGAVLESAHHGALEGWDGEGTQHAHAHARARTVT